MKLECICGNLMNDVGYPNDTEHLLIGTRSIERLQDLVDREVEEAGTVDMWPEHWDDSGATVVWKCYKCSRLYVNPQGTAENVIVYAIEKVGIP
jgi:hypothetical protein